MNVEQKDEVTRALDSLCKDIEKGAQVPNPHALTCAMKKLFGPKLWIPPGNVFAVRTTVPVSWGTDEANYNEEQDRAEVIRLTRRISSYL